MELNKHLWHIELYATSIGYFIGMSVRTYDKVRGNDRDRVVVTMIDNCKCVEQDSPGFIPNPCRAIHLVHNMDLRDIVMAEVRQAFEEDNDMSPSPPTLRRLTSTDEC
jgi:hypothetical protein